MHTSIQRVLIVGYGREGMATEAYLARTHPGVSIDIADRKDGDDYLTKQHGQYDLIIKTPGIPKHMMRVPYTTATNLFFSQVRNPIIGVTGSKGKSTVASLIHAVLTQGGKQSQLVGNVGIPMLSALMHPIEKETIFVVELSSYQLDDINHSPHVSVITSLFPDHMTYHGSLEAYYQAKKKIIAYATAHDHYVYHDWFPLLAQWAGEFSGEVHTQQDVPFSLDGIHLLGNHNKENIKLSYATAKIFAIADSDVEKAVYAFDPLPHRLALVGEFRGIRFYDDAIATTPEATIEALRAIDTVDTILLGGEDRGYEFHMLVKELKNGNVRNVVLFPQSGEAIKKAFQTVEYNPEHVLETQSMEEAVAFAYAHTQPGRACLLSCASPSYSLWRDFNEKGDQFVHYVNLSGHRS